MGGTPSAGLLGLMVVLALFAVTALLIRSMSKRLKRLPASYDPPVTPGEDRPDGSA